MSWLWRNRRISRTWKYLLRILWWMNNAEQEEDEFVRTFVPLANTRELLLVLDVRALCTLDYAWPYWENSFCQIKEWKNNGRWRFISRLSLNISHQEKVYAIQSIGGCAGKVNMVTISPSVRLQMWWKRWAARCSAMSNAHRNEQSGSYFFGDWEPMINDFDRNMQHNSFFSFKGQLDHFTSILM